ncbi:ferritin-like domain-containing protein [Haloplasma contractile]|uniref:Ferritin protein n=1 Tax=Haloplasma contractile SSD-17B TaxID=1033810 RepID=U2EEM2_9MOLU|nr:ferritin-like domain-containing protein [Haloplasma contractile]ERJ13146.1 Ferritin protein [Haloplasma contractile SSD-17B]
MDQTNYNQIINELNKDISIEYAQAIQYIQHANTIVGAPYIAVIEELYEHANDSFEHAKILNGIVHFLGGTPTATVTRVLTSEDTVEMLKQDLMYEYETLRRYLQRIRQLEALGLFDSAQKIRNIVTEEQEHVNELEVALGIDRTKVQSKNLYFE